MTGTVIDLRPRLDARRETHRIRHVAFKPGINLTAQRILANLMQKLAVELDGVVACEIAYDRATGGWIEHVVWAADRAPPGEDIPSAEAVAVMSRARGAGC